MDCAEYDCSLIDLRRRAFDSQFIGPEPVPDFDDEVIVMGTLPSDAFWWLPTKEQSDKRKEEKKNEEKPEIPTPETFTGGPITVTAKWWDSLDGQFYQDGHREYVDDHYRDGNLVLTGECRWAWSAMEEEPSVLLTPKHKVLADGSCSRCKKTSSEIALHPHDECLIKADFSTITNDLVGGR